MVEHPGVTRLLSQVLKLLTILKEGDWLVSFFGLVCT